MLLWRTGRYVSVAEGRLPSNMRWDDLFETSSSALKSNKSRSALTILGIVIGIAAVIMMLSIGQSAQGLILSQVAELGADLVFVEPSAGDPTAGPPDPFIEQTLDLDDAEAIRDSGFFSAVSSVLVTSVAVERGQESRFAQIQGVEGGYNEIFPADLIDGRYVDESDVVSNARVAVLGIEIAEELFGDQDPVGLKLDISDTSFRVIGVYDEQGTRFFQNLDQQITIPVTTMQRDVLGVDYVSYISMRAIDDIEIAKDEVRFILRDEHDIDNPERDPEKDDFFVSSQSDAVEIIGVIGGVLTILLASIAAISLIVGGIGIMNIMLVSVTERTKEIGLRKSVGATYQEILQQFLLESVLLTLIGGLFGVIIGVVFSVGSALVVQQYLEGWDVSVSVQAIVLGVIVATAVGVLFGIYPARRAAKLEPVDALRYE